jgi:uncharacterized cupin superfamily protein
MAALPVAAVSSSTPFDLRGAEVKVEGVPSWPILAGDVIATKNGPAVIMFKDGSRVTLQNHTKAKIENTNGGISFRLLDGVMQVASAPGSNVRYLSGDVPVSVPAGVKKVVSTGPTGGKIHTLDRSALPPVNLSTR